MKMKPSIIILSARHGLPIDILSMGLCGGTTPATLAGTLVVTTNAEILGGIVLIPADQQRKSDPIWNVPPLSWI